MDDLDPSNILQMIVGFFALMLTIFMAFSRIIMVGVMNPLAGIVVGLLFGGVWFKIFTE